MAQDQELVPDFTGATKSAHLVPEINVRHIGDLVRGWATDTLISCAAGEQFWYETSMVAVPTPTGQAMTMTAVVVYTSSALLDQPPVGTVRLIGDFPLKADVESAVRSAVEELRQRKSAIMKPYLARPVKDQPQA